MKLFALFFLFALAGPAASAYQQADAFILEITDKRTRILSPTQWSISLNLIVKNKTLLKLIGRLENQDQKVLKYFTIDPRKDYSLPLPEPKGNRLFFVSMVPPMQKMELKIGSPPREIPPQRD